MRISCKCGGQRLPLASKDPQYIAYKCSRCEMVFTQKKRGLGKKTESLMEILTTFSITLHEFTDRLDSCIAALNEEYGKDKDFLVTRKEE